MISKREKNSLIFKVIFILFFTILIVLTIGALQFHTELIDSSSDYEFFVKELVYSVFSAFFIIGMLYIMTKKELHEIYHKTQRYALSDALTGLNNRYYLNDYMEKFTQSSEDEKEYGVAILDIDYFRKVNDAFGYAVGDCILKELALTLKLLIEPSGVLCRYDGEEFVVIFNNMPKKDIFYKLELICQEIQNMIFECEKKDITLTMGISTSNEKVKIAQVLQEAELALYMAKKDGKNCIKVFPN